MQRSRFGRAHVGPKSEAVNNPPNQAWQAQPINSSTYGDVKLYNPNDMAHSNYNHNFNLYSQESQNMWPNGDRAQAAIPSSAMKEQERGTFNGKQGSTHEAAQQYFNWGQQHVTHEQQHVTHEQHNNTSWAPNYSSTQQAVQTPVNTAYTQSYTAAPNPDGTSYSNYNDAWNWGQEDDTSYNGSNVLNQPSGRDNQSDKLSENIDEHLNENYQRWNLAQHFQYDWSQSQQLQSASNLSTLPTVLGQETNIEWSSRAPTDVFPKAAESEKKDTDNVMSDDVKSDIYVGDTIQEDKEKQVVSEISNGTFAGEDQGSVAAYFYHGNDEESEFKEKMNSDPINLKVDEMINSCPVVNKSSETLAEDHGNQPWSSYLRADSWMSNSSLVTYNRSFTGSQEFLLSGSLYGGEDGAGLASRVTGLCQSVDDVHISSHSLRPAEMAHPLHTSYSAREDEQNNIGDQNSDTISQKVDLAKTTDLTADAEINRVLEDGSSTSNQTETNLEVIPTHDDNVEVPGNSLHEDVIEKIEERQPIAENIMQQWSQDDTSNEEVPSSVTNNQPKTSPVDTADVVQKEVFVTENVEVVEKRGCISDIQQPSSDSVLGMSWSRETSAFQPPIPTAIRTTAPNSVIQREITDDKQRDSPSNPVIKQKDDAEGVNLEMVPDNAERPMDGELAMANKKNTLKANRLNPHTSTARHRQVDLKAPSPGATLWDSPDLGRNLGSVLAPPAKGGQSQNALVVPNLAAQSENLSASSALLQPVAQQNEFTDNSLQRQMAVGGSNEPTVGLTASPLDLSSRAAPQGRSFIDDESQRRGRLEPTIGNLPDQPQPLSSHSARGMDMDPRTHAGNYSSNNSETDSNRQWRQGSRSDYWRDGERDWENRQRSRGYNEDYNRRSGGNGADRRNDSGPSSDARDVYGQSQWRRDSRSWDRDQPPQMVDPYNRRPLPRTERDRSRPSSRASNQDYESERYYDKRDTYMGPEDNRGSPPRSSSRSGYESDHGSERHQRYAPPYPQYDYYNRDPHYNPNSQYTAYNDYMRYPGNQYQDPRQYSYYGMSAYDYGYYAELYGNDPRYRAYYDSVAKGYYWQQQQQQQRYDEYDRQSVHSGRSSVTDASKNSQIRRSSKDFSAELNESNNSAQLSYQGDRSELVYDDSYVSQSSLSEFNEQISAGVDILSQQRLTPAKFSIPHVRANFSPSGKLVIILPNSVVDGQPASVDICDSFVNDSQINSNNALVDGEQGQNLSDFPGPLIRGDTHKNDVIQFCLQKIRKAKTDVNLPDRDSCILIWELLILLVRQNGVVVGTDIAELLLKDQNYVDPDITQTSNTSDETVITEPLDNLTTPVCQSSHDTNKFLEFLLYGHKKDALEWAMKRGIWGHALFLASKMDTRTYAMVMTRFANSLKFNHPLQTLYQLMSGRQPASVTSIADEKWGDWRPHLAVILSNSTQRPELDRRSVVTLGDTLASKGCLHAAHFCYLMAQLEFGSYTKKSCKLVLIGANHSLPFSQFATEEAIQCTEIYEYVQSLANPNYILPHLQFYKFLYASRLVDAGYPQKALHYIEVVASSIHKWPHLFDMDLARQEYELAYRLKYHDPHYLQEEGEIADIGDPLWLKELWNIIQSYNAGTVQNLEYEDQKLSNDSIEQSPSSDAYGLDSSAPVDSTPYQPQAYPYGLTSNTTTTGYQDINQQSAYTNSTSQQQNNSNFALTQEEYAYTPANNTNVQQDVVQDYQTTNYNYDGYYGVQTTNFNQQMRRDSESRVDPEIDYYEASTPSNTIASVNTSSTAKTAQIRRSSSSAGNAALSGKESTGGGKANQLPSKSTENKDRPKQGSSWLGGIFSKFSLRPKNQMILPDDKNPKIVWDPKSGKWINVDAGEEEEDNTVVAAPPKDLEVQGMTGQNLSGSQPSYESNKMPANPTTNPPVMTSSENRYKLRPGRGMRNNYVDVLGGNVVPVQTKALDAALNAPNVNSNYPVQFLVPLPVSENENPSMNFVQTTPGISNEGVVAQTAPLNINSVPISNQQTVDTIESDKPMMMYNPSAMAPTTSTPNSSAGLHRYGRRPR